MSENRLYCDIGYTEEDPQKAMLLDAKSLPEMGFSVEIPLPEVKATDSKIDDILSVYDRQSLDVGSTADGHNPVGPATDGDIIVPEDTVATDIDIERGQAKDGNVGGMRETENVKDGKSLATFKVIEVQERMVSDGAGDVSGDVATGSDKMMDSRCNILSTLNLV